MFHVEHVSLADSQPSTCSAKSSCALRGFFHGALSEAGHAPKFSEGGGLAFCFTWNESGTNRLRMCSTWNVSAVVFHVERFPRVG